MKVSPARTVYHFISGEKDRSHNSNVLKFQFLRDKNLETCKITKAAEFKGNTGQKHWMQGSDKMPKALNIELILEHNSLFMGP